MNCDYCHQPMNYCFYINDAYWIKVVGEEKFDNNVGNVCAHCTLERLGGLEWRIVWTEPASTCLPLAGESGIHAEPTPEVDPCAAAGRHVCGPLDQLAAPPQGGESRNDAEPTANHYHA